MATQINNLPTLATIRFPYQSYNENILLQLHLAEDWERERESYQIVQSVAIQIETVLLEIARYTKRCMQIRQRAIKMRHWLKNIKVFSSIKISTVNRIFRTNGSWHYISHLVAINHAICFRVLFINFFFKRHSIAHHLINLLILIIDHIYQVFANGSVQLPTSLLALHAVLNFDKYAI